MAPSEKNLSFASKIPEQIMMEVSAFPSMPRAGIKLRALLNKEDVSIDEIEEILRHDPGLAANVLRLANSAFFGLSKKVRSLKQAVMLLGVKRFAQIAVSACINKILDTTVEGYNLSPGEIWFHSIAVSNAAEQIGKNRKLSETDDAFTPGLLHDMGKLVLGKFIKEESKRFESLVKEGIPMVIAEQMVFETDHAEIGALILYKWSFPPDIVDAVHWHHNPEQIRNSNKLSDIVYLSNLMCQTTASSESELEQFVVPSSVVLKRLGINLEQYRSMLDNAIRWMNELSDSLSFE